MSDDIKTAAAGENPAAADEAEKDELAARQTCFFCAIVQADFPAQMDVFRWLLCDRGYIVVAILHDRDRFTPEDIIKHSGGGDVYTRKNGDGTESQFRAGDIKPAHYHIMIKTPKKTTLGALCKRFCGQVNFQRCGDRFFYAAYLLHETFDSQQKAHYEEAELIFSDVTRIASVEYYRDCRIETATRAIESVRRAVDYVRTMQQETGVSARDLLGFALDNDDTVLVKSMMAHGYFYKTFVLGEDAKKGVEE